MYQVNHSVRAQSGVSLHVNHVVSAMPAMVLFLGIIAVLPDSDSD
jgi:hypothetical protein